MQIWDLRMQRCLHRKQDEGALTSAALACNLPMASTAATPNNPGSSRLAPEALSMACMQAREAWCTRGICACSAACTGGRTRGLSPAQPWPAIPPAACWQQALTRGWSTCILQHPGQLLRDAVCASGRHLVMPSLGIKAHRINADTWVMNLYPSSPSPESRLTHCDRLTRC